MNVAAVADISESQRKLIAAQGLFNEAASVTQDDAERALAKDLAVAVSATEPSLGKPVLTLASAQELVCLPDVNQCPKGWAAQGSQCAPTAAYQGACKGSTAFFGMSTASKLAFVHYCGAELPCQEDCAPHFAAPCPSLWLEVAPGVCEAPVNYVGDCGRRANTASMSDDDKKSFGLRCGARWACAPPAAVLPQCARDHSAACPLGWRQKGSDCIAPVGYTQCGRVQSFSHLTPVQKEAWASKCGQPFPCGSRTECAKDFAVACPVGWYDADGGDACVAPPGYGGSCAPRLTGLGKMSPTEKESLATRCAVSWPCAGELAV